MSGWGQRCYAAHRALGFVTGASAPSSTSEDPVTGVIVPVSLESTAQLRFLGEATLRMTYSYSEIEGRAVKSLH